MKQLKQNCYFLSLKYSKCIRLFYVFCVFCTVDYSGVYFWTKAFPLYPVCNRGVNHFCKSDFMLLTCQSTSLAWMWPISVSGVMPGLKYFCSNSSFYDCLPSPSLYFLISFITIIIFIFYSIKFIITFQYFPFMPSRNSPPRPPSFISWGQKSTELLWVRTLAFGPFISWYFDDKPGWWITHWKPMKCVCVCALCVCRYCWLITVLNRQWWMFLMNSWSDDWMRREKEILWS